MKKARNALPAAAREAIEGIFGVRTSLKSGAPITLAEEVAAGREAIRAIFRAGPYTVSPDTIARVDEMSDAEVLSLKYELRDFLRAIADASPSRRRD